MLLATKPPLEMFEGKAATIQRHYEGPSQGNYYDRTEYPDEGGIFVHYFDHPYPAKGQPFPEAVAAISIPKKLIMATIRFANHHYVMAGLLMILSKIPLLNILIRRYIKSCLEFFVRDFAHTIINPYILEEKRFCRSIREVRRAGKAAIEKVNSKHWKAYHYLGLDIVSSVGEWDNAYRYRGQAAVEDSRPHPDGTTEIFCTIDKKAFRKNPSKEIARIVVMHLNRERGWHEGKGRSMMFANAVRALLFFSPEFKKLIIEFVNELNIDEVKLDEADRYYNLNRADFDIYSWPMETRWKEYQKIYYDYQEKNSEKVRKGKEKIQQAQILTEIRNKIVAVEGLPIIIFFAVREGEKDHVRVKFTETPFSIGNPHLLPLCRGLLVARENQIKNGVDKNNGNGTLEAA